jgi:phenylalanyl-tRNA synthetase alpha subunit
VTIDTAIPAMPNKVLAEPDDVDFHMSQVKLDEQIEECNEKLTELNKDFELTLTKLKDDPKGGRVARKGLSGELQSQFKEQAIYQSKKNEIRKVMEAFEKQIAAIGRTILTK